MSFFYLVFFCLFWISETVTHTPDIQECHTRLRHEKCHQWDRWCWDIGGKKKVVFFFFQIFATNLWSACSFFLHYLAQDESLPRNTFFWTSQLIILTQCLQPLQAKQLWDAAQIWTMTSLTFRGFLKKTNKHLAALPVFLLCRLNTSWSRLSTECAVMKLILIW